MAAVMEAARKKGSSKALKGERSGRADKLESQDGPPEGLWEEPPGLRHRPPTPRIRSHTDRQEEEEPLYLRRLRLLVE